MTLDLSQPRVVAAVTGDLERNDQRAAKAGADALELRIDLYEDALDDLRGLSPSLPVIATNRPESQGGRYDGGEEERVEALLEALDHRSVDAVDVELEAADDLRDRLVREARNRDASVIVSHHDFETTPPTEEILELLDGMGGIGDVAKLAVTPSEQSDVLRLLEVLLDYEGTACVISMGELGAYSRVVAPLHGSLLTYGNVGESTAPGQLSVRDLVRTLELFGAR